MSEATEKPKIFELGPYALYEPVEGNKRAILSWSIREQYPRVSVFTNVDSDKAGPGKGVINAAFDLDHFMIFLDRLEAIARGATDVKEKATVKHFPRDEAGNIKGDREVTSEVWYGKDQDGMVWISVQQPQRPKIAFKITLSDFHEFFNKTGQPATAAEGSVHRTIVMVRVLRQKFMERALAWRDTSIPRPKSTPYSQRGKQGGAAKNNYNQESSYAFDDSDIPV